MTRWFVFLLASLLAATSVVAGELRTGRNVRRFQVVREDADGFQFLPSYRHVYRAASFQQENEAADQAPVEGDAGEGDQLPADSVAPIDADLWTDQVGNEWTFDGGCDCGQCGACGNYWFDSDFLLWWRRGQAPPVLAATNVLPSGNVLFGGDTLGDDARAGARFEVGGFLHYDRADSLSGRFWALGKAQVQFDSNELDPSLSVMRPFVDVEPGSPTFNQEIGLPIHNIGGSTGSMTATLEANVWGGDVLLRHQFHRSCGARGDVLIGYHGSRIDEDIVITQNFTNQGVSFLGRDVFNTKNDFHGLVLGLQVVSQQGPWTIDLLAKVAMGDVSQRVDISGFEIRNDGFTVETTNGSLLALPTNIGFRERNKFAVAPEVTAESRWLCQPNLELAVGYSFLFWSDVIQAGEIIDRTVNGSQTSGGTLNGVARPNFVFQDGTYWVHGVNFGLTWWY